jgi:hypothetical protein
MASTEDIKDIKDEPGASSEDEENGKIFIYLCSFQIKT